MIGDKLLGRIIRQAAKQNLDFEPVSTTSGLPPADPSQSYMLYLHVPFCMVLCPFCSFHRVQFRENKAEQYFAALRQEIDLCVESGFRFSEAYFGGGTPTVLPDELAAIVRALRNEHGVGQISAETNPDDLDNSKLEHLAEVGINRLSVGVQSFDDDLLRQMERYDKYGSGEQIAGRLKKTNGSFDTLNVDMMFNFPKQTKASIRRDLAILTDEIGAEQVSWYPLMSSKETRKTMAKEIGKVDYGRERGLYHEIADHMLERGYHRSSAWCFSRGDGMIDEYITENIDYLGLGSGSFSLVDGTLYGSTFSINNYLQYVAEGHSGVTRQRRLGTRETMQYYLLVKLFSGSLDLDAADAYFGRSFYRGLYPELTGLRLIGAARKDGRTLRLTESGQYLWVMLMREFFASVNEFRERMRLEIPSKERTTAS